MVPINLAIWARREEAEYERCTMAPKVFFIESSTNLKELHERVFEHFKPILE